MLPSLCPEIPPDLEQIEVIQCESNARKHKSLEDLETPRNKRICLKQCSVVLERLIYKEVTVTAPTPQTREIFYSSTYDDDEEENDCSAWGDDKYEDWRLQTIDTFDFRHFKKKKKKKKVECTTYDNAEPEHRLTMRFPEPQDIIFSVGFASGGLHSILNILSGEAMHTPILDAYLMLRLEQYWKKINAQNTESEGKSYKFVDPPGKETKRCGSPTNFQYLSFLFMPVKDRDQCTSTFKVNMKYFPELEKDVLHSCRLIAPQYASKHFYLAVLDFPCKTVQIHDSSWHYLPLELRIHQLKTILKAIVDDPVEWKFDLVKRSSPQYDEYSCGIYTIYYAETLLKGVDMKRNCRKLPTQTVKTIRRRIVKQLLSTTQLGQQFLKAISYP